MALRRLLATFLPSMDDRLIIAAKKKHLSRVRKLLAAGANPNAMGDDGRTALLHAIPDVEVVRSLLKAGADPNATDRERRTALFHASPNVEVVRSLLAAGANVDAKVGAQGHTLLQLAVQWSASLEFIQMLLVAGADPNAGAGAGQALPLVCAVEKGRLDLVVALLKARADPHIAFDRQSKEVPALDCAVRSGHVAILKKLILAGGDPYRVSPYALATAAGHEHVEVLKALVKAAPDFIAKCGGTWGEGPLTFAIRGTRDAKSIKVLLALGLYSRRDLNDASKLAVKEGRHDIAVMLSKAQSK